MENYNKYISGLKRYVPALPLGVHMTIVNFGYEKCINDSNHIYGFWAYYIILLILTGIWEGFHSYYHFLKVYPHKSSKSRIIFTVISTLVSVLSFFALTYFIQSGKPFSCYYSYSNIASGILFFLTYAVVCTITYVEQFYWGKAVIEVNDLGYDL